MPTRLPRKRPSEVPARPNGLRAGRGTSRRLRMAAARHGRGPISARSTTKGQRGHAPLSSGDRASNRSLTAVWLSNDLNSHSAPPPPSLATDVSPTRSSVVAGAPYTPELLTSLAQALVVIETVAA